LRAPRLLPPVTVRSLAAAAVFLTTAGLTAAPAAAQIELPGTGAHQATLDAVAGVTAPVPVLHGVVEPPVPEAPAVVWPSDGPVTSEFGPRWGRLHNGFDIGVPIGAPVVSMSAGTVVEAGWQGGYGQTVVVDHGGGLTTLYAHLSVLEVATGAWVEAGSQIALSGNTGRSTGPHLHFETRVDDVPVDPRGTLPPLG
jgi:murein DD-endopeptidase MepM/ murein hydrolase activator NlpD